MGSVEVNHTRQYPLLMTSLFKALSLILLSIFLIQGMDVRRKSGTTNLIGHSWQVAMKVCSFTLIGTFSAVVFFLHEPWATDWLALAVISVGTAFVGFAKRELGNAHTFTGQCLTKPTLVVTGIYARTRNPLYFGVLVCEMGACLLIVHQMMILLPHSYSIWLAGFLSALGYAISFNWLMAVRESRYLKELLPSEYQNYASKVPFVLPRIRRQHDDS